MTRFSVNAALGLLVGRRLGARNGRDGDSEDVQLGGNLYLAFSALQLAPGLPHLVHEPRPRLDLLGKIGLVWQLKRPALHELDGPPVVDGEVEDAVEHAAADGRALTDGAGGHVVR